MMRIKEQGSFGIVDVLELPDEDEFDVYTEFSLTRKSSLDLKPLAKPNKTNTNVSLPMFTLTIFRLQRERGHSIFHTEIRDIKN